MKKMLPLFLCILLLPSLALAPRIDVVIKGNIGGSVEYFEMESEVNSVQEFLLQWYNSESVSCKSRMEFEIYSGEYVESVWSESRDMLPGVSDSFRAYWVPAEPGNYSVKIVVHHCQDEIESGMMNFSVNSVPEPEESINMRMENEPGRKIKVYLESEKDLENVLVVPSDYPMGWIFSGVKTDLKDGEEKALEMGYEASVWREELVTLQALTSNGLYSSEKTRFLLKEEISFWDAHGVGMLVLATALLAFSLALNVFLFLKQKKR